jgi:hypothetical protein
MRSTPPPSRHAAALLVALLAACSSGSKGSTPPPRPPGNRNVRISWSANHEKGVNALGGGYVLQIDGGAVVDLPWSAGVLPTFLDTILHTGTHVVLVQAYQRDVGGSATPAGSPVSQLTMNVP